ncbi:MAG: TonB-dependent siderophore receptor [Verrucomicrobia bacterium]|nr:TonB-dependent siderophore receptor [Verrucomicrobiota bacterium]
MHTCKNTTRVMLATATLSLLSLVPLSAQVSNNVPATAAEQQTAPVLLSPFQVSSEGDEGYSSRQTSLSTRSAKNLLEIPSSVQIVNRTLLDDLSSDLQTALDYGVSGVSASQKIVEDRVIRGFRSGQGLRNGVVNDNYKKMPLYDVDRVEAIKGPLNMVLATNFIGGGINTITKPTTLKFAATAQVLVGDYSTVEGTYNQSGPLYINGDKKISYRVTLGGKTGKGEKEAVHYDNRFVGGSLRFDLGGAQSLVIDSYFFADNDYETWEDFLDLSVTEKRHGFTVAKLNPNSTPSFSTSRSRDTFWKNNDFHTNVQYFNQIFGGSLRISYTLSHDHDHEKFVQSVYVNPDNYTVTRRIIPATVEWLNHNLQVDYRYDLDLGPVKLENMIGMDYYKSYMRYGDGNTPMPVLDTRPGHADAILDADSAFIAANIKQNYPLDNPQQPAGYDDEEHYNYTSYYLQENVKLFQEKLILIGGLRYNGGKEAFGIYRDNGVPSTSGKGFDRSYTTYRVGLIYKILPTLVIYAQQAENVILQSGVERPVGYDGPSDPGELKKDQQGGVKEVGIKFDQRLSERMNFFGSLVYFNQYLTNVDTNIVSPRTGLPYTTQSARNEVKGWEFDFTTRIKTATGNADLIVTCYKSDGKDAESKMVDNSDTSEFSIFGKYSFTTGPLKGIAIGGGVHDTGEKRSGGDYIILTKPTYDLFGHYEYNAHLSFQVNLHNITSERNIYSVAASGLVQVTDRMRSSLTVSYAF